MWPDPLALVMRDPFFHWSEFARTPFACRLMAFEMAAGSILTKLVLDKSLVVMSWGPGASVLGATKVID
jgi:hypothetical protein